MFRSSPGKGPRRAEFAPDLTPIDESPALHARHEEPGQARSGCKQRQNSGWNARIWPISPPDATCPAA